MANYEIDVVDIVDGDIVTVGPNDKILGIDDGATEIIILRWVAKR